MQALSARFWGTGFLPSEHQGCKLRSGGDPVLFLRDPEGVTREDRRAMLDTVEQTERDRVRAHARPGDPVAHRTVGDGLPHADERARADRLLGRGGEHARDVRPGGEEARLVRGELPAGAAARGARRALHPALHARLGRAQQPARGDPRAIEGGRPAAGGAARRTCASAGCSTTRSCSGRASSGAPVYSQGTLDADQLRPRPPPALLHAAGWRAAASSPASATARPTTTPTTSSRTRSRCTTCTRRCCTCSGFDHEKLTYRSQGRDFRLTDVTGKVIREWLA